MEESYTNVLFVSYIDFGCIRNIPGCCKKSGYQPLGGLGEGALAFMRQSGMPSQTTYRDPESMERFSIGSRMRNAMK